MDLYVPTIGVALFWTYLQVKKARKRKARKRKANAHANTHTHLLWNRKARKRTRDALQAKTPWGEWHACVSYHACQIGAPRSEDKRGLGLDDGCGGRNTLAVML